MAKKYRVMKYMGDDQYSHAVFLSADVKGMTSPICGGARPIVCGCSRPEAIGTRNRLEKENK